MISTKSKSAVTSASNCFIKNREDFLFTIHKSEVKGNNNYTAASEDKKIKLFVDGVIYNRNANQLLEGLENHGIRYINEIEGTFAAFVISDEGFFILSDKAGTRKSYYALIEDTWYISNNIDLIPKQKCSISPEGLGCYLANGVMLNDLTIFREIRMTERANIYSFKNGNLSIENYWNVTYGPVSDASEEELQKELERLLLESIRCRVNTITNAAVSLSAGYDARGILGIIHYYLRVPGIFCFSYTLPENKSKNSDPYLAAKIAEKCGYTHKTFTAYGGDFVEHIIKNAREGKCLTNFCEEIQTWGDLKAEGKWTDVFCGDECFGYFDVPVESKDQLLGIVSIVGASGISWLENYIPHNVYQELCNSLEKLTEEVYKKTEKFSEPHDKKDYLYFDQRINHVLLPWRENICSKVGFIHNPYLDSRILEFIMKLPPALRKEKILFKKTIKKMLPELFAIDLAKTMGYAVDWQKEIFRNREKLISYVESSDSALDDLIPKEAIIDMLKSQGTLFEVSKKEFIRAATFIRKKNKVADKVLNIFLGPMVSPKGHWVFPYYILLRLLVVRAYLTRN